LPCEGDEGVGSGGEHYRIGMCRAGLIETYGAEAY
jgi:hypothetical protein